MLKKQFRIEVGETEQGLPKLPPGNPIFTITVETLPSWNDLLSSSNRSERIKLIKQERGRGYAAGVDIAKRLKLPLKLIRLNSKTLRGSFRDVSAAPVTNRKLFCLIKVWRERSKSNPGKPSRKRDIYNPAIKAFIDGLTDAGLWIDDNEEYHTDLWISYRGLADAPKIEIKFYENGE